MQGTSRNTEGGALSTEGVRSSIDSPAGSRPDGLVDALSPTAAAGWAWNASHPDEPVTVGCEVNGHVVAWEKADQLRPDLRLNGKGDGRHAFRFAFPKPLCLEHDAIRFVVTDLRYTIPYGDGALAALGRSKLAQKSVLAVGFSHLGQVIQAYNLSRGLNQSSFRIKAIMPRDVERYRPFYQVLQSKPVFNENFISDLRLIVSEERPQIVVAFLWANQHFYLSTARHPKPFDFVLPDRPDLPVDPGAQVLPVDVVQASLERDFKLATDLIGLLKTLTHVPIYLAPAPPPVDDLSLIPGGASEARLDEMVHRYGFAPAHLRLKFWRLCESIHSKIARDYDLNALPVPDGTTDSKGFRERAFLGRDWIHANRTYGGLVLKQIEHVLSLS